MRFEDQQGSGNIEDRRGEGGGGHHAGGFHFGGGRLPMGRGGLGLGGLVVLLLIGWFAGIDPMALLSGNVAPRTQRQSSGAAPTNDAGKQFVSKVLATTETCWHDLFREKLGRTYEEPILVLFRDEVSSACGVAGASVGPFYCPGDHRLYLDLSFFDELERSLGAGGDFARAYVIAHEVGHHVQNLLGTSRQVQSLRGRRSETEYNRASVQLELQADYFAGVWAHYVEHRMKGKVALDAGDYEEAITAANAIGDDTLQRRATGRVVPEKFTHGTSAQRAKWFRLGFESGDPTARDPFKEEK
jgi:predicted metalloprotease